LPAWSHGNVPFINAENALKSIHRAMTMETFVGMVEKIVSTISLRKARTMRYPDVNQVGIRIVFAQLLCG
jgi:hypothetical protein